MKKTAPFPVDAMLLLGPTGSGKSPLGNVLLRRGFFGRSVHHFDFGASLRSAFSDASSYYSAAELDFIHGVLEQGRLLENEHFALARKIITRSLDRCGFLPHDLLILNGLPRHAGQALDMAELAFIHAIVILDCDANTVCCRLRLNSGGDREGRCDDRPDLVQKKLILFHERTRPLIDHYRQMGRPIYRLSIGERTTAEDAYTQLSLLAASDPPVSLVAEPPQG